MILLYYLIAVSVISVIITVYDKLAAKAGLFRIPEATLLFFAAIGGAAAMYITMQLIRHKTPKFMISLPFFCAAHFALMYFCLKQ